MSEGRDSRVAKIKELEKARGGTTVIAYVTSTCLGLETHMAMDVIPRINRHLEGLEGDKSNRTIDLFLHSNGGDSVVPWRLVSLIREHCSEFNVLVPCNAFSAATLTCLGADHVYMHRMGMLGPTDPTVTTPYNPQNPLDPNQFLGVNVEDVAAFVSLVKEDVGIRHEDELVQAFRVLAEKVHPLALGNVKRATSQSRMLGEKLLKRRPNDLDKNAVDEIIEKLTSRLYYHGHPINRSEAKDDLGLRFVDAPSADAERLMWELFEMYASLMKLHGEFHPIQEAYDPTRLPIPAAPQMGGPGQYSPTSISVDTQMLGPLVLACIESAVRTDVRTQTIEVTLHREWTGEVKGNLLPTEVSWKQET